MLILQDINIALAPEELENLDELALKKKYLDQLETEKSARSSQKEDYSDVIDEENAKKKRKAAAGSGPQKEKSKKFKF